MGKKGKISNTQPESRGKKREKALKKFSKAIQSFRKSWLKCSKYLDDDEIPLSGIDEITSSIVSGDLNSSTSGSIRKKEAQSAINIEPVNDCFDFPDETDFIPEWELLNAHCPESNFHDPQLEKQEDETGPRPWPVVQQTAYTGQTLSRLRETKIALAGKARKERKKHRKSPGNISKSTRRKSRESLEDWLAEGGKCSVDISGLDEELVRRNNESLNKAPDDDDLAHVSQEEAPESNGVNLEQHRYDHDLYFTPDCFPPPIEFPPPAVNYPHPSIFSAASPSPEESRPLFPQVSSYCYRDLKKAFYNTKLSLGALGWMEKNKVWGKGRKKFTTDERKLIRALKNDQKSRLKEDGTESTTNISLSNSNVNYISIE